MGFRCSRSCVTERSALSWSGRRGCCCSSYRSRSISCVRLECLIESTPLEGGVAFQVQDVSEAGTQPPQTRTQPPNTPAPAPSNNFEHKEAAIRQWYAKALDPYDPTDWFLTLSDRDSRLVFPNWKIVISAPKGSVVYRARGEGLRARMEAAHHHGEDQYPDFKNLMKWDNVIIDRVFDQRLLAFWDREGGDYLAG
jgi:hypothetical protein